MESSQSYVLGLDSSTQSLTGVLIDVDRGEIVYEKSLDYARDERLNGFGIQRGEYIIPPRQPGEADQPPLMFLASIDALFEDIKNDGIDLSRVAVINDSGQQHGQVYLSAAANGKFRMLCDLPEDDQTGLVDLLSGSFSYGTAPIWKTSNTARQADDLRSGVGGKIPMIRLTGSDSPLRFSGAVIRRVGEQFAAEYSATETIQLISSFLPAVLTGNPRTPWDFGNGCGTSLMDYRACAWSAALVSAAAKGLPGGAEALEKKLPGLVSPHTIVGSISRYFSNRYGFDPGCRICAGSGDNPQTKVLVKGDLLSLGTSFVNMVSTDGVTFDESGYANAMYDGVGRPFTIGCRTNGAMVFDRVRRMHGLAADDYATADATLAHADPGGRLFLYQPDNESFPPSGAFDPVRIGYDASDLTSDYAGIIESSLGLVYLYSRGFAPDSSEPIFLTGGMTKVPEIVRRVAALWNRPVVTIGTVGAALGAAVAGAVAFAAANGSPVDIETLSASVLPRGTPVNPRPTDATAFHGDGGYLERLDEAYKRFCN